MFRTFPRLSVALTAVIMMAVGCTPKITGFTPPTAPRMTEVVVNGDRLGAAMIEIDGAGRGSWLSGGDRATIIPQGAAPSSVNIRACNSFGCSGSMSLPVTAAPGGTPVSVNVSIMSGPNAFDCDFFGTAAECVTITGTGMYPGNASLLNPRMGPNATAGGVAALGTVFLTPNTLQVYFPDNVLGPGPFPVVVANTPAYGGLNGTTANTFTP